MQTAKLCSDWLFFAVFDNWIIRLGETVVSGGTYLNRIHGDCLARTVTQYRCFGDFT